MRKEKIKGLVLGFIIGMMITGGTTLALNASTLYDVITDGVSIVVDGKKLNPTDVNGNRVQPMIYNGTTYLPVRAVANALGKAVYWDGPNYTVYLGEMDGKLEYPTVYLKDMTDISEYRGYDDAIHYISTCTDNYGNTYNDAFWVYTANSDKRNSEYLLDMKYSRFRAILFVPKGDDKEYLRYIKIVADGKTIYTSPKIDKTSRPVEVDVNVKGYNDLKICYCTEENVIPSPKIYLADAGFYQ